MADSIDPSIKVMKSIYYRGQTRTWSNRYYFDNLKPADAAKWLTFSDAVVNAEKLVHHSGISITGTLGYDAGSDVPVYSKSYATAGTGSWSSTVRMAGDCAALVRYSTAQKTEKNHPIYLFNYYHGVMGNSAGAADDVNPGEITALTTYATLWVTGISDGAVTHHRCGPQGHTATGVYVHPYVRHRDFPAG